MDKLQDRLNGLYEARAALHKMERGSNPLNYFTMQELLKGNYNEIRKVKYQLNKNRKVKI